MSTEELNGTTTTYTHDATNQLTDDGTNSWTYDGTGNRTNTGYSTGTGNQLTGDGTWTFSYDDEGNLTKKTKGINDETWTYGYDHRNQMEWVEKRTTDGGTLEMRTDYAYDVYGNRIEKAVDSDGDSTVDDTLRFAYDGWKPGGPFIGNENFDIWADLDGDNSNALETRYLRGDIIDQLFARIESDGTPYWLLTDRLGSVRDVINNSGTVKDTIGYDGFGNIISESDSSFRGRYAWTGRELDVETKLQYNRARYYDPGTGRWLTQDPLGFDAGDSNVYRYVHNRPTTATDPSGNRTYIIPALYTNLYPIGLQAILDKDSNSRAKYDAQIMPWGPGGDFLSFPLPLKSQINDAITRISRDILMDLQNNKLFEPQLPLIGGQTVGLLGPGFGHSPLLAAAALCPAKEPLVIVGHSTGGYIATKVAAEVGKTHRVDHLVLLGVLPDYKDAMKEERYQFADLLIYAVEHPTAQAAWTQIQQYMDPLQVIQIQLGIGFIRATVKGKIDQINQAMNANFQSYLQLPANLKKQVQVRVDERFTQPRILPSTLAGMDPLTEPAPNAVANIHNFHHPLDKLSMSPQLARNSNWNRTTHIRVNSGFDPHKVLPWMPQVWNYVFNLANP